MSTSLWDYFYRLQKRAIHAKAQHDRVRTKLLMCLLIVFAQLVCICSYLTHIFVCHRMSSYKAQDAPIKLVLQKNLKRLRIPDMEIHVPGEEVEQLNAQQRYCRLHQINQARYLNDIEHQKAKLVTDHVSTPLGHQALNLIALFTNLLR